MDQSFNLKVPNRKYVLVEYPGRVKNVDRALKSLGGEKTIANALNKEVKTIELRYRPEDPFSHPVVGDVVPTSSLLLKVTKRKKKNQPDDEAAFKAEALGTILKSCRFRAMADFQYLVPKDEKFSRLRSSLEKGNVNEILNYKLDEEDNMTHIPPPVFSMRETPFDYAYHQFQPILRVRVRQRDGSYAIKLVNRFKRTALELISLSFEDTEIPTSPKFDLTVLKADERALADEIKKLFEERPVWTRVALLSNIAHSKHSSLRGALNANAYTFRTGPFRECWIKYGIDPRKDQKYHVYQNVDIRGTMELSHSRMGRRGTNRLLEAKIHKTPLSNEVNEEQRTSHLFDGRGAVPKSALLCLCDVTDTDFKTLIYSPGYMKSVCTKRSGFYYDCVYDRIRVLIKKKVYEYKLTGKAASLTNATQGLEEAIAKEIKMRKYDESTGFVDKGDHEEEDDEGEKGLSKEESFAKTLREIQAQGFGFGSMDLEKLAEFDFDVLYGEEADEDIVEPEDVEGEAVGEDEEEEREDKSLWELNDFDL
ncbi:RNA polymerase III transcription factor IIIC subunit-domain-containing protein [Zychaea mexicana]|uniref:RNA polymerase III transcription factor IIIC subunit-domain-containing protein n=1 Tax=Zychaea mexicana TaxID=64656 RepID=UPI0022FE7667|nr:RNA polymerase III transcription factor IIIC subunit-domain-containing protein [Zychaea mexicana]KAI9497095.1 RNA polymerase III transcription factor IIIC subunit-domain-containing protein [Zychaea mexicana]